MWCQIKEEVTKSARWRHRDHSFISLPFTSIKTVLWQKTLLTKHGSSAEYKRGYLHNCTSAYLNQVISTASKQTFSLETWQLKPSAAIRGPHKAAKWPFLWSYDYWLSNIQRIDLAAILKLPAKSLHWLDIKGTYTFVAAETCTHCTQLWGSQTKIRRKKPDHPIRIRTTQQVHPL